MIGANLVISFVYLTYKRQDQLSYYTVTNGLYRFRSYRIIRLSTGKIKA